MQMVPYMLATVVVGMVLSTQPPLNSMLGRAVGSAYGAATISIAVALASILVFIVFSGWGDMSRKTLGSVPWWVYLSGIAGAIFVASGPVVAPVTGAMVFFVCIVAGQLIGSMLADHFGAFGLDVRTVSVWRLLGLAMVLGGALLVSRG
ncbi:hypothetical protein OA90_18970 [Labrenzia sp. OB1]|nr:hypothetical protein OA90_18970 [Labrenzia sp. OB1]